MTSDKRGSRPRQWMKLQVPWHSSSTSCCDSPSCFCWLTLYFSDFTSTLSRRWWGEVWTRNQMRCEKKRRTRKGKFTADSLIIAFKKSRHISYTNTNLHAIFNARRKEGDLLLSRRNTRSCKRIKKKKRRWDETKKTRMTLREFRNKEVWGKSQQEIMVAWMASVDNFLSLFLPLLSCSGFEWEETLLF